MPLSLVRHAIRRRPVPRLLPLPPTRRKSYDVVIVGGGGHGLATAYYLQKNHGINNVAVFEKSWLAGDNTARNTAIIRSNYLSETAINFYKLSMQLFSNLSHELDFNIMYSERGHLTLAHSDSACRASRWRVNMNRHLGVDSEYVDRNQIAKICPQLNLSHTVPPSHYGRFISSDRGDCPTRRRCLGLRHPRRRQRRFHLSANRSCQSITRKRQSNRRAISGR